MRVLAILVGLGAPTTVGADTSFGYVTDGPFSGNEYLVSYKDRVMSCKVRKPCTAFGKDVLFLPALKFARADELIDYTDDAGEMQSCMLRECRDL